MTRAEAKTVEAKVKKIRAIAERGGIKSVMNWADQAMRGIENGKEFGYYFEFCEKVNEAIERMGFNI